MEAATENLMESLMEESMKVTVLYYARLADKAGREQETLTLAPQMTLPELYEQLSQQYDFGCGHQDLEVIINNQLANWSDTLGDGDSVAFMRPIAGG